MAPKTIFITGASSGIGLASAKLFHSIGWNVVATMRNPTVEHELVKMNDSRMFVQRLDLQEFASIQPAIDAGIGRFGSIDVLLNNAGYGQSGLFEAIPREKIQEQFDVNLFGLMDVTRAILPHFRANHGGGVINVSSGAGLWSLPMTSMYSASKFALEGFTEALWYELRSQNIFVKSVIPHGGVTSTEFGTRFSASSATEPTLTSYNEFTAHIGESFRKMIAGASVSSADVAETIRIAATDGTDQLRYFIGNDARGFVRARYESRSDKEYMAYMRSFFE
ncbi:3-oxoacyl-(Acyl-carrier-protein) reductase [Mycena sanguinolenta]|uniref:3-oxoacyl-(Acyl-carrier-protein) reductase n=1 Tax=Mycena sanguinolenta TaxID=230812 RepID=A0A8H6Z041_9AGAR|nr:3-oxoacyl-(Acyl-carrier-protein) reductase [Mycena sanguinolenta]